uniref:Uncharacterized protein n=1 Tax=Clastoptera arizonana TaxID=38151 RepID=A0A1B6CHC6_9HEMI
MKLFLVLFSAFAWTLTEDCDSRFDEFKPILKKVGLESWYPKIMEEMKKKGYLTKEVDFSVMEEIEQISRRLSDLSQITKRHKKFLSDKVESLIKMIMNKLKPDFKALNYSKDVLMRAFNLTESEVVAYKENYNTANSKFKELELYLYKDTALC